MPLIFFGKWSTINKIRAKGDERMTRCLKRYWPLLVFAFLLAAVAVFFIVRSRLPGPEEAVKGYLTASLHYDVDDMLFFASDYQKKALAGNADIPEETLRENLKSFYASQNLQPETGEITFSDVTVANIEPSTERYRFLLSEYGYKADPEKVREMALVSLTCFVSGTRRTAYRVVAVRCGARWYYGFIEPTER